MKVITVFIPFFLAFFIPSSCSSDWYVYEHDLTTENLNFIDTIMGEIAVGNSGVVLVCYYPISFPIPPNWENASPPTSEDLYGAAVDSTEYYVVGTSGIILYSDGLPQSVDDWVFIDSPTNVDLYSISIVGIYGHAFIVGAEGIILYGSGDPLVWEIYESSPTNNDLYSVEGDTYDHQPNTTWAVGANGTILDYEDGVWSLYPSSPTTQDLYGVYVYDENYAWACGAGGTIIFWDEGSWSLYDTPTNEDLYSIWWSSNDLMIFAVGANGTILSSDDGYNWVQEDCPVDVDLNGVGGYNPDWAVGEGGTILSRDFCQNIQPTSIGRVKALFAPEVEGVGSTTSAKEKLNK